MMNDKSKTRLSALLYLSMFVLPGVFLAIGWIGWGFRVGAIAALAIFAVCFVLAGLVLTTVRNLSWIAVAMPFSLGVIYAAMPHFTIAQLDDAVVLAAGALLTFGLWVRKQPDTPKWIVFPLLVCGVYTLVGTAIPGPVDELLVGTISVGTAIAGALRHRVRNNESQTSEGKALVGIDKQVQDE